MNTFYHFNFNVLDLQKSMDFYEQALGLTEVRRVERENFTLVYLGDGVTDFTLELTYLHDRTTPYNLGECEFHLALHTDDYEAMLAKHTEMGCVSFVNPTMGIYFITDPDGYWIELVPSKR